MSTITKVTMTFVKAVKEKNVSKARRKIARLADVCHRVLLKEKKLNTHTSPKTHKAAMKHARGFDKAQLNKCLASIADI